MSVLENYKKDAKKNYVWAAKNRIAGLKLDGWKEVKDQAVVGGLTLLYKDKPKPEPKVKPKAKPIVGQAGSSTNQT